jgi:intein/homing endonuclease
LKKEEAKIIVDKGVFNKPGVFIYPSITVDLKTENVKVSSIHNLYNVNKISEQKKYFLKAFLLGLYDLDKILLNSMIIESINYNRYIDRLIDLYNSNELPIDLRQVVDYILDFTYKNNLENDFIKMKV